MIPPTIVQLTQRWVTLEKAEEITGLPVSFFHERTGASGIWPENKVWKWFEGRKLIDMDALYGHIDQRPSVASKRGRRAQRTPCPASPIAAAQAA